MAGMPQSRAALRRVRTGPHTAVASSWAASLHQPHLPGPRVNALMLTN